MNRTIAHKSCNEKNRNILNEISMTLLSQLFVMLTQVYSHRIIRRLMRKNNGSLRSWKAMPVVGGELSKGYYVSLAFGLSSVFIWTVAEIPQIVTNFKSGSTEGLSLTFLNQLGFSPQISPRRSLCSCV